MKLKRIIQKNNVAVSSVIAVILMVSITVGLASGAYLMLSSINNEPNPIPNVTLLQCQSTTNPAINTLTFVGADTEIFWEDIGFSIHYLDGPVDKIFDHGVDGLIEPGDLIDIGGNDGVLNLELGDGVMRVVIIHTLSNSMLAEFTFTEASDSSSTTVDPPNNPPVVTDILDQVINGGDTFAAINLDDYVTDAEDPDSAISWSYSGNSELIVDITNRVATITHPDENWDGSETITFTATDTGDLSDSDSATFTVAKWWWWDEGRSVKQTMDGGYIITGFTWRWGTSEFLKQDGENPDVWLIKTDENGDEEWNRTFGGMKNGGYSYDDEGMEVLLTSDGGYIILGQLYVPSFPNPTTEFWLIKTDSNGNEQWNQSYNNTLMGGDHSNAFSLDNTNDGGYIIVGSTTLEDSTDIWLIKADSSGNKIWDQTFRGAGSSSARSVKNTNDGGYIIAGKTNQTSSAGNYYYDLWLIKTDSNGNHLWNKTFGTGGFLSDDGESVLQADDGGYIITGRTQSYGVGSDVWLIKTDNLGNEIWNRTFGGINTDYGYSVNKTSGGGYIITGYTKSYGSGWGPSTGNLWLIKTNSLGIEQWNRSIGNSSTQHGRSVWQTNDGGYIITGKAIFPPWGPVCEDVWLVKTDAIGNVVWHKTFDGGGRVVEERGLQ